MSLHPEPICPVPAEAVWVAHTAFPRGYAYLRLEPAWVERYGPRFDDFRLPKGQAERRAAESLAFLRNASFRMD